MINFLPNPVACVTPLGNAIIWYITTNSFLENDEVTVILCDSGAVKHMTTADIKIWHNETYGIKKQQQ